MDNITTVIYHLTHFKHRLVKNNLFTSLDHLLVNLCPEGRPPKKKAGVLPLPEKKTVRPNGHVIASMASRPQESGLPGAFGGSRKLILGSVWVEFVTVGLISGFIAVMASEILFYQIQNMFTDAPFVFH